MSKKIYPNFTNIQTPLRETTPVLSQLEKKKKESAKKGKDHGVVLKRIERWDSHDSATYPVVNGDVRHSRPGTSEHVVGVIGGKLGGVVKTSIPVRFPNDTAGQTLGLARAPRRYPVQMLYRGFLFRCGQVITARKSREMREKMGRGGGKKRRSWRRGE